MNNEVKEPEVVPTAEPVAKEPDANPVMEDGLTETFSEEDLSVLSEPEIEQIRQMEADDAADVEAAERLANPDPEPEPEPEPAKESEPVAARPELVPLPEVPDIKDATAFSDGYTEKVKGLKDEFADGSLSDIEYADQIADLATEKAGFDAEIKHAGAVQKQHDDRKSDEEQRDRDEFTDKWNEFGVAFLNDHPELKDTAHLEKFDEVLRDVTGNNQGLSFDEYFDLAHSRYSKMAEDAGTPLVPQDKVDPEPKADPEPKMEVKKDGGPEVPPTLASIPASDVSGGNDGRFASLDRELEAGDPDVSEAAIAAMSPQETDNFLAGR